MERILQARVKTLEKENAALQARVETLENEKAASASAVEERVLFPLGSTARAAQEMAFDMVAGRIQCAQDAESAACMSVSGEAKAIASSVAVTAAHDIDDPCACKRPESVLQQLVPDEEVPFSFCSHRVVHSSRTCITCP